MGWTNMRRETHRGNSSRRSTGLPSILAGGGWLRLWRIESSEARFSCVFDEFGSRVAIELALNVRAVRFGRAQTDVAQPGDVGVRVTEHEQEEHVLLPGREFERRSLRQHE